MKVLRPEIEPNIDFAEKIYPDVLKIIVDYNDFVYENGDEENIEYERILDELSELTQKDIRSKDYMIWEYWEGEGEFIESFKIALPEPKKVDSLTKEEVKEIVRRTVKITIPDYLNSKFIEENGFVWVLRGYYTDFLRKNISNFDYDVFNRQQNAKGEWYELSVDEITDILVK